MSKVIFKNQHYTACSMRDGSLIVSRNRARGGKHLIGPRAATWIKAIEGADDAREASALCRAVLEA